MNDLPEFEKWYNEHKDEVFFGDAEKGWNACKEKVLEILKSHTNTYKKSIDDHSGIFEIEVTEISPSLKREIENL